jgi:hypothetical protein
MQLQFGNVDLSDQSVFGQLIGIMSASNAQLWQAGAALYASSFPEGATGVAVDNILALNNLQRLPEAASVTNPTPVTRTDGVVLYGLRLLGTPGTVVPSGTLVSNGAATPVTFSVDAPVTIGAANNARQAIYFGNVPTTGSYTLTLTSASGTQATTQAIPYNAAARQTLLTWASPPTAPYTLSLAGTATASIDPAGGIAAIQAAVQGVASGAGCTVSGSTSAGVSLLWPAGFVPRVTGAGTGAPSAIRQATSAFVHELTAGGAQPFTDVLLTDTQQTLTLDYGAFAAQPSCPSNAASSVPRVVVASTSLYNGQTQTSVGPQTLIVGNPAQGIGTASCTKTGAYSVLAGQLTNIATPVSGLTGCTNDLDCLVGRAAESDADAIARFRAQQGSSSSGSLGSIVKRVQQVDGVSQVVAFQNTGNAASQVVLFAQPPTAGQFSLVVGGTTSPLFAYNAAPSVLQAALRQQTGFASASVSAYGQAGYVFDFAGVRGDQGLGLIGVAQNTTQVQLTPYFARPPHSVEIVAEGGSEADLTQAILDSLPAGIATYSNPSLRTTATLTQGSAQATLASTVGISVGQTVEAAGVPLGTRVVAVANGQVTLSASPIASGSNVPIAFTYAPLVKDASGNVLTVGYSRPQSVLVYVVLKLVTDTHVSPGDVTSGINSAAAWDPRAAQGIAQGIVDLINAVPIGGVVSARGTNGLVGSFRNVPGIYDFDLFFDLVPSPTNQDSLQLQSNQAPTAQSYSVVVSYE